MALIAIVSSALTAMLLVAGGYRPVREWLLAAADRDAHRYMNWSHEMFWGWTPAQASRRALLLRLGIGAGAIGMLLVSQSLVFASVIALAIYSAPVMLYNYFRERRRAALERQLPDAMSMMVASVRAGQALPTAVREVSRKMAPPVADEFRVVADEHEIGGLAIEEALGRARDRVDAETFDMIASALIINSRQGGDLLTILDRIAAATRALHRLQVKLVTETSEVRAQQTIIMWMTPLFGIAACLFDPSIKDILLSSWPGNLLLVAVAGVQFGCFLWIRRIVRTTI